MDALERRVVCLDRKQGEIIWQTTAKTLLPEQAYQGFQSLHGYSSSTPATDGERLYVFFGKSGAFAFDLDGKQLWHADVGSKTHGWGSATSPVLYQNLVIINASVESGALVALDKETGNEVWRTPGMVAAWNTPLLVDLPGGRIDLVISVKGQLLGFDPATGKERWHSRGIDDYVCPSVIAHDGVIYAIGGRGRPGLAVPAGGEGDVSDKILWTTQAGSNVSSPVYHDGYLYWVSESKGIAYCINAKTGEAVYEKRMEPRPDRIYASPVLADGKIYYVSRNNGAFVVAAKPEYELLAHNVIKSDDSVFNASPAVNNGQLLLRSDKRLYCIGNKE
jgi:outer membrane protein assembly factor BamB